MYMGYFKRKRTNKKKGKRGTKRYRGGTGTNNQKSEVAPTVDLTLEKDAVRAALDVLLIANEKKDSAEIQTAENVFDEKVKAFIDKANSS
jgi:hypothetical protein